MARLMPHLSIYSKNIEFKQLGRKPVGNKRLEK
jgi:hypothetical protein